MAQHDPFTDPKLGHFHGGAIPSAPSARDYVLPHLQVRAPQARVNHDLRNFNGQSLMVPIGDQGQVGSCTGWAWARLRAAASARYHILRGEAPDVGDTLSARFIYDIERSVYDKTYPQDNGSQMRSGGQVIANYGVAPERYCPYTGKADNGPIEQDITPEAYEAAKFFGVSTYYRLQGTGTALIDSILASLDEGWPVVIACLVSPAFEQVGSNGRIPNPRTNDQVLGGHAVVIAGNYLDASFGGGGAFLLVNQWGANWGQGGYAFMPFSFATTNAGQYGPWLAEAWTIR